MFKNTPTYDQRVIKAGESAVKRLIDPKGSRDMLDWWAAAAAWKMAQDEAVFKADSDGPYGETFRGFIKEWLSEHKSFAELPASTRSNLIEMEANRTEIQKWYADIELKRRLKINSPSAILQNWKRDGHVTAVRDANKPPTTTEKLREARAENAALRREGADRLWGPNDSLEDKARAVIRALQDDDMSPQALHRVGELITRAAAAMLDTEAAE